MRRNRKDLRLRNVHALVVARGAVEELEGAAAAVVADVVALAAVAPVAAAEPAVKVAVVDKAEAAR
nr:hypothetical protein [Gemmatimonadota bacterium]